MARPAVFLGDWGIVSRLGPNGDERGRRDWVQDELVGVPSRVDGHLFFQLSSEQAGQVTDF